MHNANKILILILTATLMLLNSSCMKEDLSDCPRPFNLTLRAWDADMQDITESGDLQRVVLFIFDEAGKRVERTILSADHIIKRNPIYVEYFGPKKLHFIAWANPTDAMLAATENVSNQSQLEMTLAARANLAETAPDLFSGNLLTEVEYGSVQTADAKYLDLHRRTAQVNIIVLGYKDWLANQLPRELPEYADILIGTTPISYTALSELQGAESYYRPNFQFKDNGDIFTKAFNVYPTLDARPLDLDFFVLNNKVLSVNQNAQGIGFVPVLGRMLNILVDLRGANVNVTVVVTPWDEVYQFAEY